MVYFEDIDGLIADAKRAKACGFQGKLLIHPTQIQPYNDDAHFNSLVNT